MAEQVDLSAQMSQPTDPVNPTDLEKKHIPVITAPDRVKAGECFEVTVEVSKLLAHPNENGHFVEFIDLYAGKLYVARLDLTAKRTCPVLKLCVALEKDLGPLRAFARCNLHGVWESTKQITIEQFKRA
jgi:superoxide reductase